MTHIIIAINEDTYIHQSSSKSPEEIFREIDLGVYEIPLSLIDPKAVRVRNYILIAEREEPPMISKRQKDIMELLSLGASETEIAAALKITHSGVRKHIDLLKKKFDVSTREEIISIYCRTYK